MSADRDARDTHGARDDHGLDPTLIRGVLDDGAVLLHETFTSLLMAGFTERQALYVVAMLVVGPPRDFEGGS